MYKLIVGRMNDFHIGNENGSFCGMKDFVDGGVVSISSIIDLERAIMLGGMCCACVRLARHNLLGIGEPEPEELLAPLVGYKAIRWSPPIQGFLSPLQPLMWPRSGYVEATCPYLPHEFLMGRHVPGSAGCECGIYATLHQQMALEYLGVYGVLLLVDAVGLTDVWTKGFRSEAAQVRAVVRNAIPETSIGASVDEVLEMNSNMAAKYFEVERLDWDQADALVRQSWKVNDCPWEEE